MCDAILILTAISAGATVQSARIQAQASKINNKLAEEEAKIRNSELQERRKLAKINAKIEENNRRQAYARNIATMRALGKGKDNPSFLSILNKEEQSLRLDIDNIRLGRRVQDSRLSTQIAVNTVQGTRPDLSGFYTAAGIASASGTVASGLSASSATKSGG
tara:strand:- start:7 stop:492 length:486 start_codon:yes stop_codon:yes gene_type:complete